MSLVVYSLKEPQSEGENKHQLFEKIRKNIKDSSKGESQQVISNNDGIEKSADKKIISKNRECNGEVLLDRETCNEVAQTCSLIGMLENLKKLSIATQVAIESITKEADKTFERVYNAHEKFVYLKEKVKTIKEFYDSSKYEEIKRNQIIQRVDFTEPEQGRFNSETIPDGWYEQYQKCEGMPNFKILDEYLLQPPYLQTYYKNYSNPEGLFSTWKESFVRHLRNEQLKEMHTHHQKPQTRSMIRLKNKHSVGDVIVPEKKVKRIIPVWQKFDKNNGSKVSLSQDASLFENIQQITISENEQPTLVRSRSSVLRSAGSQKKIDTSCIASPEEPKVKTVEEKMRTLLKKTRSENNTHQLINHQPVTRSENDMGINPPIEMQSSNIPPVPTVVTSIPLLSRELPKSSNVTKEESVSSIPTIPPVPTVVPISKIPPVPSVIPTISITQNILSTGSIISEKAQLKPTSPREQIKKNDNVADLFEGIRKGIKLSKASERKLADKPAPKQSFDVFSVLKEKFKFANAEMSTDSFCPSASGTFTEDW